MATFNDYLSHRNIMKEHIKRAIDELAETPNITKNMDTKIYNILIRDGVNINPGELISYT